MQLDQVARSVRQLEVRQCLPVCLCVCVHAVPAPFIFLVSASHAPLYRRRNGRKALELSQIYPRWIKRDAAGMVVAMPLVGQVPLGTPLDDGGVPALQKIAALSMKDRPLLPVDEVEPADASSESGVEAAADEHDAGPDASAVADGDAGDAADDDVAMEEFLATARG